MSIIKWTLAAALSAGLALPAASQDDLQPADNGSDNVQIAYVYGADDAPACPEGDICVFARLPENERYRIPPTLRTSDSIQNSSWASRVEELEMVGNFGTFSCSPAGAGGSLGCTQQLIDAAFADKREGAGVRFSQLIQAARDERLSTIDEDAAMEQERVEQIEREYLERLERERQEALPGEDGAAADSPTIEAEPLPQP